MERVRHPYLLYMASAHLAEVARAQLDGARDLLRRAVAQLDAVVDDDLGWRQGVDGDKVRTWGGDHV